MSDKITWNLIEVKASELKPNPHNPKTKDAKGFRRLQKSLEKFGKVFDGIANKDLSIIDGHRRLEFDNNPEAILKYFVPSRQLSEKEYTEMNAVFDIARAGEPDQQMIEEQFEDEFFDEWEINKSENMQPKKVELKPYIRTHILLSFPPEKMMYIQKYLEKIIAVEGVEYEQSNN